MGRHGAMLQNKESNIVELSNLGCVALAPQAVCVCPTVVDLTVFNCPPQNALWPYACPPGPGPTLPRLVTHLDYASSYHQTISRVD